MNFCEYHFVVQAFELGEEVVNQCECGLVLLQIELPVVVVFSPVSTDTGILRDVQSYKTGLETVFEENPFLFLCPCDVVCESVDLDGLTVRYSREKVKESPDWSYHRLKLGQT